ncbi:MAG: DUF6029 family protein [Paludibacter sp.]|jgi:hypothetical protein|nr:DUF6029 family protein [Paludibacter sp.]
MNYKKLLNLFFAFFAISLLSAQISLGKLGILSGSVQSDVLFPQEDSLIGAKKYEQFALTNTYVTLNLASKYVDAGARFEFLKYPLPGFESDFAGWGVPNFYATGKLGKFRLTAGDFYEQFGSGLILRTYEDRTLGIDNSLRGGRLAAEVFKGVNIKLLAGQQRRYWTHNDGYVAGADAEFAVERWFKRLDESATFLTFGTSFVSKNEPDETIVTDASHSLVLPKNVAAYDFRMRLQKGDYSFLAEYAGKINDPSKDNGYIYKNGSALLVSASFARSGISALLQAKRSDNMSFRSRRSQVLNSSFINNLPAFTTQQTYTLAALYPYATQPDGEWAFQGGFSYLFKRKTALGGKYGTTVKIHASHIRDINKQYLNGFQTIDNSLKGSEGYKSSFFKMGETLYYQDVNLSIDKKITTDFKLNLMYMYQYIDLAVVRKEIGVVKSNIFIAEGKYQLNKKNALRGELQYLQTKDDEGDWIYGTLEWTLLPSFMFTVSDMYNAGATNLHYYKALVTYTVGSHFIQAGFGRTRAGRDCSGGVCRDVPASKGFTLSYNYTF